MDRSASSSIARPHEQQMMAVQKGKPLSNKSGLARVNLTDERLVRFGEIGVPIHVETVRRQFSRNGIHHDRLRIEGRVVRLSGAVLGEQVFVGFLFVPANAKSVVLVHGGTVPLDVRSGTLMFVHQSKRMAEFMKHDPAVFGIAGGGREPAEIHRSVGGCKIRLARADIRLGAALLESDSDICVRGVIKNELDAGVPVPLGCILLHFLLNVGIAFEKLDGQRFLFPSAWEWHRTLDACGSAWKHFRADADAGQSLRRRT
jgi:hypothetical protein